jgi:hypothetical protein
LLKYTKKFNTAIIVGRLGKALEPSKLAMQTFKFGHDILNIKLN